MKRIFLVIFIVIIVAGLMGCAANTETPENTLSNTPEPRIEATEEATEKATEKDTLPLDVMGEIINVKEFVNVRTEASIDSDILGHAALGSQWMVLNPSIEGGWMEIQHGGQIGYIKNDYISIISQSNTVPTEVPSVLQMTLIECGYADKQASNIEKVLNSIGITMCTVIIADKETSDGMMVVLCYFNGSKNSAYFSTVYGEIAVVGSETDTWYDTEQGGIIKQYEESNMQSLNESLVSSEAEKIEAEQKAEEKARREVTFDGIYAEYKANELRADDTYKNNRYYITAEINGMNFGGLLNLTGGATLTMEKKVGNTIVFFYAEFEKEQEDALKKVNVGDAITFEGTCQSAGYWTDCEIVE